jgi:3-hydroxybutyryl-CoA dehydrogenase
MTLKSIGVLGAGTRGKGIIRSLAGSNLNVIFREISQEKVDSALQELSLGLDREKERWGVTESEKRLILSRIRGTTDVRDLAGVQVVVEAAAGDLEDKQKLFHEIDQLFPTDTVVVGTSATVCISDIGKRMSHPERIVGMHFCLPVHRRKIVEVVQARETSEKTMAVARLLAKFMKKTVIDVFEMPGLITTRIMIPYINEAAHIVMEGLAGPYEVDDAVRLGFKLPIGPLAMADEIGLDTLLNNMERLFKALGDLQYRPCPLLRRMVREGHLGAKTRRGFFFYDANGKRVGCPADGLL